MAKEMWEKICSKRMLPIKYYLLVAYIFRNKINLYILTFRYSDVIKRPRVDGVHWNRKGIQKVADRLRNLQIDF